ncbi:hypothetical protein CO611_10090 [Lysobacteraceae bacterium NML03-0222]|nr:hypothetical protein CO611_10090 [Xanthomonadaceae bacterium NML03-0222]PJK07186.1 hypothetical protein CO610_09190 [Xanthomonadaceae bacterium NML95-0200]PJK12932.1 hypothetical protein CO613_10700 [Xanthomonadaceae bacterium NML07-0707]
MKTTLAALALTLSLILLPHSAQGRSPERAASEAARQNAPAITIWVDASWGFRNQGAANNLSAAHRAFYAQGYRLVSVQPYIENGDLQGFFVSYEKRD